MLHRRRFRAFRNGITGAKKPRLNSRGLEELCRCGGLALTHFLDPRSLALQVAQVVKLGAANPADHHHLDLVEDRSVQGENPLNTHAIGDFAYGKGRTDTVVTTLDADALKDLDTLFVTLGDLDVDTQCIPRLELGDVFPHIFHADVIDNVHRFSLLKISEPLIYRIIEKRVKTKK